MLEPSKRMSPSMRTPSMRSFSRLKHLSKVDLPHPEGPMKAVTMFFGMSSEISCRARDGPYHIDSCMTWMIGSGMVGDGVGARSAAGSGPREMASRSLLSGLSLVGTILMFFMFLHHAGCVATPQVVSYDDGHQVHHRHHQDQQQGGGEDER